MQALDEPLECGSSAGMAALADQRRAHAGTDGKVGNRGVSEGTDSKTHLGAARLQSNQARTRCRQSKAHLRAVGSRESPRPRVASYSSHTPLTPQIMYGIDDTATALPHTIITHVETPLTHNRRGVRAP